MGDICYSSGNKIIPAYYFDCKTTTLILYEMFPQKKTVSIGVQADLACLLMSYLLIFSDNLENKTKLYSGTDQIIYGRRVLCIL